MIDLRLSEEELERRREHIVDFIRETAESAGTEQVVLGLSGGIDSTLVANLAVEALGADGVRGLVMPGVVSDPTNMSDAEKVAERLGIEYDVVEISPITETVVESLPEVEGDKRAIGNARARFRAVLSYLVANHDGRLVVGTGNRTEALVGYFTKYGDGAVDCHPIGNLYKQQVRQLADHVGVRDAIITKPSTAGLWANQTDEGELGIDYDTLDIILALHIDGRVPKSTTAELADVDVETVERVRSMYERSEHKRRLPPEPERLP